MAEQQLVKEKVEAALECRNCQSLLTIYYREGPRYFCENCDEELSALELEWDDDGADNNIRVS